MIVVIDYGIGNSGSILNMLKKVGAQALFSSNATDIENATKLILPGVGAFDNGMKNLMSSSFFDSLQKAVLVKRIPILGICLGMQLFSKGSEEGALPGLGWIDCHFKKFSFSNNDDRCKVPHMGWNFVDYHQNSSLFQDMPEKSRFYFVHSYYAVCSDESNVVTTTRYGIDFVSSIRKENIYGVQFHPEKSHRFGLQVLKNFTQLC